MATTHPSKPPANLKDRIAALEQRTSGSTTSPPTSPTTTTTPPTAFSAQSVGTLKDKIARFERKGKVPVPRGSLGLGAPPAADGPRRQGEFYGNRIQSITPQYTGGSLASIGSYANSSQRRSFSATGNFDDSYLDSTTFSSPTTTAPPESPGNSPEASPSRPTIADIPVVRRNAPRGTSFHEALEFARKVEAAKKEALNLTVKKKSADSADTHEQAIESPTMSEPETEEAETLLGPAILVSSDDPPASDLSLQLSGVTDSQSVEPSASEAEVKPLVDTPEMKRSLSLAESTTLRSDNQISTRAESVKGSAAPSTSTSISASTSEESRQKSSPGLEIRPSDKLEDPTPIQTPQTVLDDVQTAPTAARSSKIKLNTAEPKLPDDRSVEIKVPVAASAPPTDVGTSNVATPSVPATDVNEQSPKLRSQIPVPRVRPTIQPPDSASFLSPPSSGYRSAQISAGSSVSSFSSRPISTIETSEVSRALKMTPATGRGVPVFLPPANPQTRKSDFVFLPSTPEASPSVEAGREPSSVSLKTESDLGSNTFKTVVHGKVKETPASATLPVKAYILPETPMKDPKRATILQNPLSPGHGELAALLQEAMLLSDTLNKGELPAESPKDESANAAAESNSKALEAAKAKEEERQRIAQANAPLRPKRDPPTHGRLKHTFLMPLSKARAAQKQEPTAPIEQAAPHSSREESRAKGAVSDHMGAKEVVHEKSTSSDAIQTSPSKIPKLSKFPSFKRFGSISRTVAQQEALLRHSNSMSSELSSEDSNLIVTPPDNGPMEFGERRSTTKDVDQQSVQSQSLSFSFPSLSPKKSASIGRAASFAEKMWSRARTKSNGSVLSLGRISRDRSTEELTPQLPVLSELPHIPSLGSLGPPLTETGPVLHRPASGSSLRHAVDVSARSTSSSVPFIPVLESVPSLPNSSAAGQPMFSPMSMSSIGSLPSPLFDKEICDAFPSVPTDTPTHVPDFYSSRARGQGLTAAASVVSADFDSALLSSAIHLASRKRA